MKSVKEQKEKEREREREREKGKRLCARGWFIAKRQGPSKCDTQEARDKVVKHTKDFFPCLHNPFVFDLEVRRL